MNGKDSGEGLKLNTSALETHCKGQLEGSEQERSLDFSAIFESVHMPKFNYFWTLSKMAEKSRDRSCSEPFNLLKNQIVLPNPLY